MRLIILGATLALALGCATDREPDVCVWTTVAPAADVAAALESAGWAAALPSEEGCESAPIWVAVRAEWTGAGWRGTAWDARDTYDPRRAHVVRDDSTTAESHAALALLTQEVK
jgi:hypothetical protein